VSFKLKAALALAGVVAFAALAVAAHLSPTFTGDAALARLAQGWRPPFLDGLLRGVSFIGYGLPALVVTLAAAAGLYAVGRRWDAVFAVATLLGDAADVVLKVVVARPRPGVEFARDYETLLTFSFPSGHATHTFIFYGYLIVVVAALPVGATWRRAAQAALALLIVLTGLSRVYLGAHWPSDVVGGWLLGALMLWALLAARRRIPRAGRD